MEQPSIKVIYEPTVRIVGRQVVDQEAIDSFLEEHKTTWETDTPVAAEKLCEMAGRVCYMSFGKGRKTNQEYLGHILEVGHGSVLEHAVWNFIITGVSRSLTHELVRHRAGWGFSQLSQRYVDESDVSFVVPPELQGEVHSAECFELWVDGFMSTSGRDRAFAEEQYYISHRTNNVKVDVGKIEAGRAWIDSMRSARARYIKFADYLADKLTTTQPDLKPTDRRKSARQAARSVLPNATETKIFITGNARAIRHFIEQRANPSADLEIRRLAVKLLLLMRQEAPNLFEDYFLHVDPNDPDGAIVAASTDYLKV